MRKIILVIALLLCTGCNSNDVKKASIDYAIFGFDSLSSKGVYHAITKNNESAAYFFDIKSKKYVPLCAKTDCNMDNQNNDAYALMKYKDETVLRLAPVYYEGYLYYFYGETTFGNSYLCKSKEDGTDRQELMKLPKGVVTSALFYNHKIYLSIQTTIFDTKNNETKPEEKTMGYIMDLGTKKMKELKIEKDHNISFLGVIDHNIYLDISNIKKESKDEIAVLDEDKLAFNEVLVSDYHTSYLHEGKLYYGKDNTIYSIDVKTKKVTEVMKIDKKMYKVNSYNCDPTGIMNIVYIEKEGEQAKTLYADVDTKKVIDTNKQVVMKLNGKYIVEDDEGILSFL